MMTGRAGRMMIILFMALIVVTGCSKDTAEPEAKKQPDGIKQHQLRQGGRLNPNDADHVWPPKQGQGARPEARPQQLGRIHPPDEGSQQRTYESDSGMIRRPAPAPPVPQAEQGSMDMKAKRDDSSASHRPIVPDDVRGIYVSGWIAGGKESMDRMIRLVERTDLNAMVIDVKNDYGQLTYRSSLPQVTELGADGRPAIRDMPGLLKRLKAKGIYTIGRVVAFKDPYLAQARSEYAFHRKDGKVWRDRKGKAWVDPYHPDVRAYNIAIAKEAASLGFDEIQFDYVRFPDNGAEMDRLVSYHRDPGMTKQEVIGQFLQDARDALHASGAIVSADVFGMVTSSQDDMGIGQTWRRIAPVVDVISPMIYPSHYTSGIYGIRHPDLEPARIVQQAVADARSRNGWLEREGRETAVIRPWLQAFTAKWIDPHQPYREAEIREQIEAVRSAGARQFLLWNPSCQYDYGAS